jgi:hypothetical protein
MLCTRQFPPHFHVSPERLQFTHLLTFRLFFDNDHQMYPLSFLQDLSRHHLFSPSCVPDNMRSRPIAATPDDLSISFEQPPADLYSSDDGMSYASSHPSGIQPNGRPLNATFHGTDCDEDDAYELFISSNPPVSTTTITRTSNTTTTTTTFFSLQICLHSLRLLNLCYPISIFSLYPTILNSPLLVHRV